MGFDELFGGQASVVRGLKYSLADAFVIYGQNEIFFEKKVIFVVVIERL